MTALSWPFREIGEPMMWWVHDGWNWWAWLVMSLSMVAFWAVVAWAVVAVLRRSRSHDVRSPDARAILDERFTRGEIDEDEYRARREMLRRVGRPSTSDPMA